MAEATLVEAQVGTVALDDLMVDPELGTARCNPRDEATVDRLVEALRHGETLPPIRVAPILDPLAAWCGLADHWQQGPRVAWDLKYRDDPFANRPYQPKFALVDGLSIVAATRRHLAETEPRRRKAITFTANVDSQPVGSVIEVKLRAVEANLRNGRQLTDTDLRSTFEFLWLGRPAKLKHERWTVDEQAIPLDAIARTLGRSDAWCRQMICQVQMRVALGGFDLGPRKANILGRLDPAEWHKFVFRWDGEPHLYHQIDETGQPTAAEPLTVAQMPAAMLERIVDLKLQALAEPPSGGVIAPEIDDEPEVEGGQYVLDFDFDWTAVRSAIQPLKINAKKLTPEQARDRALEMAPLYLDLVHTYRDLQKRAKDGGFEV